MSSTEKSTERKKPSLPQERPGSPEGKRAQNRIFKVEKIQESALSLFLENGIESVTIDKITQEANIAKGSFYRYFQDKEELVQSLFLPMKEHLVESFSLCCIQLQNAQEEYELFQSYETLASELSFFMLPNLPLVTLYLQEARSPSVGARKPVGEIVDIISESAFRLTEIAHKRKLWKDIDPLISSFVVIGAVEQLLFAVLHQKITTPPLSIAKDLIDLILHGMKKENEKQEQ